MNFDAKALAYVRYVLDYKGLKPGALAQKAGVSPSTLTRALNDPNHKFKLSMTTLEKIAEFSGINPGPFLDAQDAADMTLNEYFRPDIERDALPGEASIELPPPRPRERQWTLIVGEVAANVWRDPEPFAYFDVGPLHITSTTHIARDCFGFVVRDDSANLLAEPGDILFCTRVDEEKQRHTESDRPLSHAYYGPVVVERRSRNEFKVEMTVRFIRRRADNKAWELISARGEDYPELSPDGQAKRRLFQTVILDKYTGNEEYRIVGDVEHVLRSNSSEIDWLLRKAKS